MAKTKTEINYIHLIDDYYYTADRYQYVLVKKEIRNKLELGTKRELDEQIEAVSIIGYYPTLQQLVMACVNVSVRNDVSNGKIESLQDNLSSLHKRYDKISDALKL